MYGVPVLFLSGDERICELSKELVPQITTVSSKKGVGGSAWNVSCLLYTSGLHRNDTGGVRHIAALVLGGLYANHGIFRESEMVPDHGCGFTDESRITFARTGIQYCGNHCPLYQILYYRSIKR